MAKIEIKKSAYRQTKDGFVISFVLHPDDVTDRLATAPIGTCFEADLVELDYDNPESDATP